MMIPIIVDTHGTVFKSLEKSLAKEEIQRFDETLQSTTYPGQSGPGSNGSIVVIPISSELHQWHLSTWYSLVSFQGLPKYSAYSLFIIEWHINLLGLFNTKSILLEGQ